MKTAILSAVLAAVPVLLWGSDAPPPAQTAQPQKAEVAPSPKPAVPPDSQNHLAPTAKPAAADPSKLAAPAPTAGAKPPGVAAVNEKTFIIGAEDQLYIQVWNNPALTGQFLVRPDGKISMPLIGEIMASGETPMQLTEEISKLMKDGGFLVAPQVTVMVQQVNSKKYLILGEVNKPGSYSLIVPTTVLEALVNAGGFRDFANKTHILVLRGDKRFTFNYKQVIAGKHREQNIMLEPGDQIIIK